MSKCVHVCVHITGSCDKPRQCIEKQRRHFANKGPCRQSFDFFQ